MAVFFGTSHIRKLQMAHVGHRPPQPTRLFKTNDINKQSSESEDNMAGTLLMSPKHP